MDPFESPERLLGESRFGSHAFATGCCLGCYFGAHIVSRVHKLFPRVFSRSLSLSSGSGRSRQPMYPLGEDSSRWRNCTNTVKTKVVYKLVHMSVLSLSHSSLSVYRIVSFPETPQRINLTRKLESRPVSNARASFWCFRDAYVFVFHRLYTKIQRPGSHASPDVYNVMNKKEKGKSNSLLSFDSDSSVSYYTRCRL